MNLQIRKIYALVEGFMNSLMNGKILDNTPFEKIFISSCPDDSGNSIGSALFYYHNVLGRLRVNHEFHNFLVPPFLMKSF